MKLYYPYLPRYFGELFSPQIGKYLVALKKNAQSQRDGISDAYRGNSLLVVSLRETPCKLLEYFAVQVTDFKKKYIGKSSVLMGHYFMKDKSAK